MAGSINLSLSQQFDRVTGDLLSGGKLYFYQAGSLLPQDGYRDSGLSVVHANPYTLASDGRIPQLYFDDGTIRVRLTNSAGVVQFDEDNILVVGASSGSGGGSAVDPDAIFKTGDVIWAPVTGTRSGCVRLNGRTIGSSTSGASERANADCQALFELLWATYDNTYCPVSTGRGASALADWSANKTITTLDFREVITGGLSDMGNTDRAGFLPIPVERGSRGIAAGIIGEIQHTLSNSEIAPHTHGSPALTDPGHLHSYTAPSANSQFYGVSASGAPNSVFGQSTSSDTTGITLASTTGSTGDGGSHNNTPRTILGTFYQKL